MTNSNIANTNPFNLPPSSPFIRNFNPFNPYPSTPLPSGGGGSSPSQPSAPSQPSQEEIIKQKRIVEQAQLEQEYQKRLKQQLVTEEQKRQYAIAIQFQNNQLALTQPDKYTKIDYATSRNYVGSLIGENQALQSQSQTQRQLTEQDLIAQGYKKEYQAPNQYGLGGKVILRDASGNIVVEEQKVLSASTEKRKFYTIPIKKAGEVYYNINEKVKEVYTNPIFLGLEKVGINEQSIYDLSYQSTPIKIPIISEVSAGAVSGIYKDVREQPLKNILLIVAGAGLGLAIEGAVLGAETIGSIGARYTGLKALSYAGEVTRFGVGGYMGFTYASKVLPDIVTSASYKEAGGKIGVSIKDVSLLGYGYGKGVSGYDYLYGKFAVRGRTNIPIEKLVPESVISGSENFPTASKSAQLNLLKSSPYNIPITKLKGYSGAGDLVYPAEYTKLPVKVPAGSYHATAMKFWQKTLTPSEGTSELPGLYGSYSLSPYFTKIKSGYYNLLPSLKDSDIFYGARKPAVAYLQPEGFRVSPFKKTSKGFEWVKPAKKGYADVPLMKSEVEAVFRTEAGSYGLTGKNFYTTWKGVNIPLDTFKYQKELLPSVSAKEVYNPSAYSTSSLKPSSIVSAQSLYGSSLLSSSKEITSPSYSKISYPSSSYNISSGKSSIFNPSYTKLSSGRSSVSKSSGVSSAVSSALSSITSSKISKPSYSPYSNYRKSGYSNIGYSPFGKQRRKPYYNPLGYSQLRSAGIFGVSVRRFGKWKPYGKSSSLLGAFKLGEGYTARTLGASFKVIGNGKVPTKIPGYYSKKEKGNLIFIQKRKFRLSAPTEKAEINLFRKLKKKRRFK